MSKVELPPFESVLVQQNAEGVFEISIKSKLCGDVDATLAPAVAIALFEVVTNALALQLEIDKIPPEKQETFPLEVATNVVKGLGFFKAMSPEALAAHELIGAFGAPPALKGN
jgi:VIT1/CCC1 family predicted Fe2+/Mn2+ transporter